MSPTSAGTAETSAKHADTSKLHGCYTPSAALTAPDAVSSCKCPSTSVSSIAATHHSARATLGHSPTATSFKAADFATEGRLPDHSSEQASDQLKVELVYNLQPAVQQFLQPSLAALSAVESTSTSSALPPTLCQGQNGSTANASPSDEQKGAVPSSAEAYQEGKASEAQQSSAAAFLDDILAQSKGGRLFKGPARSHRLAGASLSDTQPADDLLDRNVGLQSFKKLTGHHAFVCIDAVVYIMHI